MKPDIYIDHTKNNFSDSFGISAERLSGIKDFLNDLMQEAKANKYKRSQIVEKIIEFAESYVEAILIYGLLESHRVVNKEIHVMGAGKVPKEIREALKELMVTLQTLGSPGMSVDGEGKLN